MEYWNNRYREERGQTFDWYLPAWRSPGGLRDMVLPRLYDDKEAEILIVGCGNSGKLFRKMRNLLELSEKLYEEGFHYITNADFSGVLIEEMRERNAHLEDMDCMLSFSPLMIKLSNELDIDVEMDLTEPLDILDSESFTCILDKACLDCVTCSDQYGKKTQQYLENLYRILAPGGTYLCVSHGRPETRLPQLSTFKWQVETLKVNKRDEGAATTAGALVD